MVCHSPLALYQYLTWKRVLVILIPIARTKVEEATKGSLTVSFGNAAWMTLAAAVVLWFGVIGASAIACGCCGCGKRRG